MDDDRHAGDVRGSAYRARIRDSLGAEHAFKPIQWTSLATRSGHYDGHHLLAFILHTAYSIPYTVSERQCEIHGWFFFENLPSGGVDGELFGVGEIFIFEARVLHGVVVDLFGDADVLFAVIADLVDFACLPPFDRFESRGGFSDAERGGGDVVKPNAPPERFLNFHKQIHAFYLCEIPGVIFVEDRCVKMVTVVADKEVGSLEYGPELREVFFKVGCIFVRFGVMDDEE